MHVFPLGSAVSRRILGAGLVLLLVLLGLAAGAGAFAAPSPLTNPLPGVVGTLKPSALNEVAEGNPQQSFSSAARDSATIGWSYRPAVGQRAALVRFDLESVPAGAAIQRAWLAVDVAGWTGLETMSAEVAPAVAPWSEGSATWSARPPAGTAAARQILPTAGIVRWDITPLVQRWIAEPDSNFGLVVRSLAGFPETNERTLTNWRLELESLPAELTVSIRPSLSQVRPGENFSLVVDVANGGPGPAIAPQLALVLPDAANAVFSSDGPQPLGDGLEWMLDDIPPGEGRRVFAWMRLAPDAPYPGTLTFRASARSYGSPLQAKAAIDIAVVEPPTPTPAFTPTLTDTPRSSPTPSATPLTPYPTATPTYTRIPTITPTPTPTYVGCMERVTNGGFESFSSGWNLEGDVLPFIVAFDRHAGLFSAQLGGAGFEAGAQESILSQRVRIPVDATQATLTFWYRVLSTERDSRYDWFSAEVRDAAGTTLKRIVWTVGDRPWTSASLDVTAYRGQTVELHFLVHNDGNVGHTRALVDDVSLCVERPSGPEPTPAPLQDGAEVVYPSAQDYAPAGMPDFGARRTEGPSAGDVWTLDGPAALADILWWMDSDLEPGSAPPPNSEDAYALVSAYGPWDDHDQRNLSPLMERLAELSDTDGRASADGHVGTRPLDMRAGLMAYLIEQGMADDFDVVFLEGPDIFRVWDHVGMKDGVLLRLGFRQWDAAAGGWRPLGARYVAAAGYLPGRDGLLISDPLRDAAEAGFPGEVRLLPDHGHPALPPDTVHDDPRFVSHDMYERLVVDGLSGLRGYAARLADISASAGANLPSPTETEYDPHAVVVAVIEDALVLHRRPSAPLLRVLPAQEQALGDEIMPYSLVLDMGAGAVDAVQLQLMYDADALDIVDAAGAPRTSLFPGPYFTEIVINTVDDASGIIAFSARVQGDAPRGWVDVASFHVKPSLLSQGHVDVLLQPAGISDEGCQAWYRGEPILGEVRGAQIQWHASAGAAIQAEAGAPAPALVVVEPAGTGLEPSEGWPAAQSVSLGEDGSAILPARFLPGGYFALLHRFRSLSVISPLISLPIGEHALPLSPYVWGDANMDSHIDVADLSILAGAWGSEAGDPAYDRRADMNDDGKVDASDADVLIPHFGRSGAASSQAPKAGALYWKPASSLGMGMVSFTLLPSNTKTVVGEVIPVSVQASAFGQAVDAVAVHLDFDPSVVSVVDAAGMPAAEVSAGAGFPDVLINRVDNAGGHVDFVAVRGGEEGVSGLIDVLDFFLLAENPAEEVWLRFASSGRRETSAADAGASLAVDYHAMRVEIGGTRFFLPLMFHGGR